MSELAERLNCLFDLTHKIYNLLNKSLTTDPLPNSGQSLINKGDTNSGYCDLSADLEGVKLDVVIIESRFSNSISANQNEIGKIKKEINHFRDQLFIMQKEQQKSSKEITNHDAVINELSSQACSSQDIALEYNYQSGNAVEEHIIIVLVLLIYDIISNAVSGREKTLGREHGLDGSNA